MNADPVKPKRTYRKRRRKQTLAAVVSKRRALVLQLEPSELKAVLQVALSVLHKSKDARADKALRSAVESLTLQALL